jgi:hypothetical protein
MLNSAKLKCYSKTFQFRLFGNISISLVAILKHFNFACSENISISLVLHLQIETRLIDEKFPSVMGECVI